MKKSSAILFLFLAFSLLALPSPADRKIVDPGYVVDEISVGRPVSYKGLTIFPIVSKTLRGQGYTSLDEASRLDQIVVKEKGSGDVNRVVVENESSSPVLLLGGEMIVGAKQDRMVSHDVLLPSKSGPVVVSVYCIEHGRWQVTSSEFKVAPGGAQNVVRKSAQVEGSQQGIWDSVSEFGRAAAPRMEGKTSSAAGYYGDKEVASKRDDMKAKLLEILPEHKEQVGFAAALGDRILGVDIFGSPVMFEKYRTKLLDSYIYDAIQDGHRGESDLVGSDIKDFVEVSMTGEWASRSTEGIGSFMELQKRRTSAAALTNHGELIHATLFPKSRERVYEDREQRQQFEEHPIRRMH